MTDEELIARLLDCEEYDEGDINDAREAAANRIKELKANLLETQDRANAFATKEYYTEMRAERAEAKLAKAVEALQIARVHVANNAQGWSVSRAASRDDLTIVDSILSVPTGAKT